MSSGHGKSLCFQLPSLVLDGLTIIVSPFLSLISDHISNMPSCIAAASLTNLTDHAAKQQIFDAIKAKRIKVLLTTPERLVVENLNEITEYTPISLLVYDECTSCIRESYNYRAAYFALLEYTNSTIKPVSQLFLTNCINNKEIDYLMNTYQIKREIICSICIKTTVNITVSKEDNKLKMLENYLREKTRASFTGGILVLCNTKKSVERVNSLLNQSGISVKAYHSDKSNKDRNSIQDNFRANRDKILVSTISFAIGINKLDIHQIIIFDIPFSMEHLLQQVGRAGRDNRTQAGVHIILNDNDFFFQRKLIISDKIDRVIS
jgi:RecQ family ATP-dependent DNA helicase